MKKFFNSSSRGDLSIDSASILLEIFGTILLEQLAVVAARYLAEKIVFAMKKFSNSSSRGDLSIDSSSSLLETFGTILLEQLVVVAARRWRKKLYLL